jgi:hypothetical protein
MQNSTTIGFARAASVERSSHPLPRSVGVRYSSKIIKAGALLADTKTLLVHWNSAKSVQENLARMRQENRFGKASRSRVEDVLAGRTLPGRSLLPCRGSFIWPCKKSCVNGGKGLSRLTYVPYGDGRMDAILTGKGPIARR